MDKSILIVLIIISLGIIAYGIFNAIAVNKRNKATDEATRKIFLAKMNKEIEANKKNANADDQSQVSRPLIAKNETMQSLNYDEYEDDVDLSVVEGVSLKDFFEKT